MMDRLTLAVFHYVFSVGALFAFLSVYSLLYNNSNGSQNSANTRPHRIGSFNLMCVNVPVYEAPLASADMHRFR